MSGVAREPSAAVYRRRRIAVFGGLLAVIVVVALIIWRPSLGGTPSATEEPEEDQLTEEVVPVAECTDSQIELIAETDEVRYAPGAEPQVWLTVRNTGATECELEVGSDVQELAPMTITLQPGAERSTAAIGWDRTRSNPETCNDERTQMPGGGASYHLSVKLGPFESEATRQFILD
jgi:hypothetical protein